MIRCPFRTVARSCYQRQSSRYAGSFTLDRSPLSLARPDLPPGKMLCSSCQELIPAGAIVCRQCRNYQGSYWWWRLVGVSLPWLIATVTVSTFLVGFYVKLRHSTVDDIPATISDVRSGALELTVSNRSDGPVYLKKPSLDCAFPGTGGDAGNAGGADLSSIELQIPSNEDKIEERDSRKIHLPVDVSRFATPKPLTSSDCSISTLVIDATGATFYKEVPFSLDQLRALVAKPQ